ncbi:MAG TPA: MBL fold metallo-hydrolase [Rhizobiales bacterium]|nr:MBL fold metallo-hydrolase [Hyphomicrobiales bacterium]
MPDSEFYVKFWGVRGSIPVSGKRFNEFGGSTPCIEVGCGGRILVFDNGSGAFALGEDLVRRKPGTVEVFFTHCHYDHIEGAPFFAPVHDTRWQVSYWSGHLYGKMTTRQMMENYMKTPYFPIGPEYFCGCSDYHDFKPASTIDLGGGIVIRTCPLNHPGGAVGYRVEYDGRSICYITDMEHLKDGPPAQLEDFVRDAGIMIYDAMFSDEEYPRYKGWGHSTWQEGMRLANLCNVKNYVAFHHQPAHDDATLRAIERELINQRPASLLARQGQILTPER